MSLSLVCLFFNMKAFDPDLVSLLLLKQVSDIIPLQGAFALFDYWWGDFLVSRAHCFGFKLRQPVVKGTPVGGSCSPWGQVGSGG